ncbi:hypothetical protein CC2G_013791 [Coprinopsis cinerea AmutBmut pab1-1]|nr:hypothetical protein CC2G_013791 [Coprinopsis cinerea AmutBmut pab1-1]
MSTVLRSTQAANDVLKFLRKESRDLAEHIRRFGPLLSTSKEGVQHLPNPFIPRLNPKTKRWADPKYSLRRQAELVKKAKAAGLLHMLPPGPKTPHLDPTNPTVQKYNPHFASVAAEAFQKQSTEEKKWRQPVLPTVRADPSWTSHPETPETNELQPVHWEGKVDLHMKPGADIGIKLYAGKKRMFKGHAYERLKVKREARTQLALATMDKRIAAYKNYYKKRRPNPLKPPKSTTKMPKLPF